ncbi:MAG: VanZ family protein [Acidobacteria bacterium]|nr:MAG: VanZ family protein [Acidobacteriota bacterium]
MAFFASDRERRLWLWVLAVVVAIYASLGYAPVLAGVLRQRGLLEATFVFCFLLVLATIVTKAFDARPRGVEIAIVLGVVAAFLMVLVRMEMPEERTHLIEYGVLGLFIHEALSERARHGRRVPLPPLLAILATAALGTLDEVIQAVLPSRVFDPRDILFNVLAGTMSITAGAALAWTRRRVEARSAAG